MYNHLRTNLLRSIFNSQIINNQCNSVINVRYLYAKAAMGLDNFLSARERVKTQLVNSSDKFREKMNEFLKESSNNMIFTEDLKNMVHIAENKPEDVELVVQMLKKFNAQNKELRFGNFIFGPVIMRMLYNLKDEETALKLFKEPEFGNFFDQLITYQILLDMLYEKQRYQDVLDTFQLIKSRQVEGGRYPRHVVVLTFAACYKMNTPESLQYATNLWNELKEVGHLPMRKGVCFAAALALKQNAPNIAIELMSTVKQQNYVTVRNLKCIALADIGRADDALPILRSVLEINDPTQMKHTFVREAIDKVRKGVSDSKNKDVEQDFKKIEKFLNDNGHISDTNLDDILCTEITSIIRPPVNTDRGILAASFSSSDNRRNSKYTDRRSRPGLKDLY